MSYSYSVLGTGCTSNTIARTSNNKFLPLQSPIYLKQHTYTMQYPGRGFSSSFANVVPTDPKLHELVRQNLPSTQPKLIDDDDEDTENDSQKTHCCGCS